MATITILGTKQENEKIEHLLNKQFDRVIKKANMKCAAGEMLVLDAYTTEHCEINGYTDKQILKGLECCSNRERNCEDCPYSKESECMSKVKIDAALLFHRIIVNSSNTEANNE